MAEGGSGDAESLACFKDLGLEETETEVMTTHADGKVIIQHHYHRHIHLPNNVHHADGDIVQGTKTQVKDSQIEALIAPSGESDPPRQQHPEELSEDITQAALNWIGEEKIPPEEIGNADDTTSGNQTRLKQVLGIPGPGTSETAPGAGSEINTISKNILDMDLILLEEFKKHALENADDKTAVEMINLYNNEDVEQDILDFLPLFTTIWKTIQLKIVMRFLERPLANGCNILPFAERILIKLISIYNEANEEEQRLHSFIPHVKDVIKLGEQFRSNKNFIHAAVSFYAVCKLAKLKNDGNLSVKIIIESVWQIMLVGKAMIHQTVSKQIVLDHVIPLMHEMKEMLRSSIQVPIHSIRVEHEAWCLYYIGDSYSDCGEYQQSLNMLETAIDLMKRQFGDEAENYRLYRMCLNSAARIYLFMKNFTKSIEKNEMLLKIADKANDWENDERKFKFISTVKERLQFANTQKASGVS